uniref:CSON007162 protein n=1 Tax=Culicoides sonorensis TaxID=179676 RepID=A0A336LJG4_CULSO
MEFLEKLSSAAFLALVAFITISKLSMSSFTSFSTPSLTPSAILTFCLNDNLSSSAFVLAARNNLIIFPGVNIIE